MLAEADAGAAAVLVDEAILEWASSVAL